MPRWDTPPRRLIEAIRRMHRDKRGDPVKTQDSITFEKVQEVRGNSHYVVDGVEVPATGQGVVLYPGQEVPVARVKGDPTVIFAHSARRAQFHTMPQIVARPIVEEIFIATDPDTGESDIFFRDDVRVRPLGAFAQLAGLSQGTLAQPALAMGWGVLPHSFWVFRRDPDAGFEVIIHVFELGTGEGTKFVRRDPTKVIPEGAKLRARLQATYDLRTLGTTLGTVLVRDSAPNDPAGDPTTPATVTVKIEMPWTTVGVSLNQPAYHNKRVKVEVDVLAGISLDENLAVRIPVSVSFASEVFLSGGGIGCGIITGSGQRVTESAIVNVTTSVVEVSTLATFSTIHPHFGVTRSLKPVSVVHGALRAYVKATTQGAVRLATNFLQTPSCLVYYETAGGSSADVIADSFAQELFPPTSFTIGSPANFQSAVFLSGNARRFLYAHRNSQTGTDFGIYLLSLYRWLVGTYVPGPQPRVLVGTTAATFARNVLPLISPDFLYDVAETRFVATPFELGVPVISESTPGFPKKDSALDGLGALKKTSLTPALASGLPLADWIAINDPDVLRPLGRFRK